MLTFYPNQNSIPNDVDLESDKGSVHSEATFSETSTWTAPNSSNMAMTVEPINSKVPSTVDPVINNNARMFSNPVINTDIDSFNDDGSKRFADVHATTNIVNGWEDNDSLVD